MDPLLKVESLSKHFGGFTALNGVSLEIAQGERFGLIGPNGSGKTTLINCISGALWNDSGLDPFPRLRNLEASGVSAHPPRHRAQLPDPAPVPQHEPAREPARAFGLRRAPAQRGRGRGDEDPGDDGLADKASAARSQLSQVELRKLELARAMAARPRLLIDEDSGRPRRAEVDEVLKILFELNAQGITIIMIEHIMQAVMRFSQRVVCLDAGAIICEGTPAAIVQNPDVQRAYLGANSPSRCRRGLRRGPGVAFRCRST